MSDKIQVKTFTSDINHSLLSEVVFYCKMYIIRTVGLPVLLAYKIIWKSRKKQTEQQLSKDV